VEVISLAADLLGITTALICFAQVMHSMMLSKKEKKLPAG
jgi:hypothetical protein